MCLPGDFVCVCVCVCVGGEKKGGDGLTTLDLKKNRE